MPPNGGKLHNIINSGYKDECMNNQYAVLISSEIPELGELDLLRSIYRELNGYMEDYNNQINLDDLGDWKLLIQINLRNTNGGLGFSNGQNVSHPIKSLKYLFPYQYQIWRKHAMEYPI